MASKKTAQRKVDSSAIEESLTSLGRKLSASAVKKRGSIQLSFTDSGEDLFLEGTDRDIQVSRGVSSSPPLVRVTGPASVLQAIMDGKKEARRAFIAGGIQVSGDLDYLEALLKDLGLLECE